MYKRILGVLVLAALVAVGLGYVVMQRGQGTAKVAPPDAGVQIATPAPVDAVPPAPAAQPVPVAAPQPAAMVPPTASTAPIVPMPAPEGKNVMVAPSAVPTAPAAPIPTQVQPAAQSLPSSPLFLSAKEAENAMMNYARLPVPLQLEGLKLVLKLSDEQHQKLRTYLLAYDEYQAKPVMLNSASPVGMDAPPVAGMGMAPNARPLQRRIDELKAEQARLESFQTLRGDFLKSLSKAQKEKMDKLVKPEDF